MPRILTNPRFWVLTVIIVWLTTITVLIAGQP